MAGNIRYGNPHANQPDFEAACKMASVDEFVSVLPAGYDTMVGENGYSLSGGQRQRIALARAFLRGCPLLILDEPTSALDYHSEQRIKEAEFRNIGSATMRR